MIDVTSQMLHTIQFDQCAMEHIKLGDSTIQSQ